MCEYCCAEFNVFKPIEAEEQDGGFMEIACNAPGLIVEISKTEALTFNVNYCPMCARDLRNRKEDLNE